MSGQSTHWFFEAVEDQIVHYILTKREFALDVIHHLEPELFRNKLCRQIMTITNAFFKKYDALPTINQIKALAERASISDFDAFEAERIIVNITLEPGEIDFIRDQVPKFIKRQKFWDLLIDVSGKVSPLASIETQEEIFSEFQEEFNEIMRFNVDRDLGMHLFDVKRRHLALQERSENGIAPALEILRQNIRGYYPGELYAYVGEPGAGKSIMLACDALAGIKQGKRVVLISMEMDENMYGLRIDQNADNKTYDELMHSQENIIKLLEAKYQSMKDNGCAEMIIKQFPTGDASTNSVIRYLDQLRLYENFEPDMLIIDYADIMRPNGKVTGDPYKDQGAVYRELRAHAMRAKYPVLTASQTNRPPKEVKNYVITEGRLGDSYDKLRTLDGCFSINFTGTDIDKETKEFDINDMTNEHFLFTIKNRHGPKHRKLWFVMNQDKMQVKDKEVIAAAPVA